MCCPRARPADEGLDPNPGPLPAQTYAALVGGPLDGLLLDITGWTAEELDGGRWLTLTLGASIGVSPPHGSEWHHELAAASSRQGV
ncbi:hypothetical protein [Streptomyces collinus]|uniref:hypothetical protein n=1 Tax=Streptomyces collinus TaxID=42684 RepID=UPI00381B671F